MAFAFSRTSAFLLKMETSVETLKLTSLFSFGACCEDGEWMYEAPVAFGLHSVTGIDL